MSDNTSGWIFRIQRFSLHDGPGIRTTVFLKGCPLRCPWCHNPEGMQHVQSTQLPDPACISRITTDDLVQQLLRDKPFFDPSGGGVTFSGGEPAAQMSFLLESARKCRKSGLSTGLQTCGLFDWQHFAPGIDCFDFIQFDLKVLDDGRHKSLTGAGNAKILKNARHLLEVGANVAFRMPVVPGYNDDDPNLDATATFLLEIGKPVIILLEYHPLGDQKLMISDFPRQPMPEISQSLARQRLVAVAAEFRKRGIHVSNTSI